MKVDKEHIIQEIVRTANENGGKPLGMQKFEKETGIRKYDWFGKHWSKWGDALIEAGYKPNKLNKAYDEKFLLQKIIELIREIKKFPSAGDLTLKSHKDKTFPSKNAFENAFGKQQEKIATVIEHCKNREGLDDILEICLPLVSVEKETPNEINKNLKIDFDYVYLIKSGKYYKIGRSNNAERRAYELRLQLPEEVKIIHKIKTDDPIGIEEYWHRRFKEKRKGGEWFDLTREDVEIFRRRKFM